MTEQFSPATTTGEHRRRPRWLGQACATVVTAAAVAALGVWQIRAHHSARSSAAVSPPAVTSVSTSQPAMSQEIAAQYLCLVDSDEQAAALRPTEAVVNALGLRAGQPPLIISVLVTEGIDAAGAAALARANGLVVLDLRAR